MVFCSFCQISLNLKSMQKPYTCFLVPDVVDVCLGPSAIWWKLPRVRSAFLLFLFSTFPVSVCARGKSVGSCWVSLPSFCSLSLSHFSPSLSSSPCFVYLDASFLLTISNVPLSSVFVSCFALVLLLLTGLWLGESDV